MTSCLRTGAVPVSESHPFSVGRSSPWTMRSSWVPAAPCPRRTGAGYGRPWKAFSHRPIQVRSATVQKRGNSPGVRIPKVIAQEVALETDSEVDLSSRDGAIIVFPIRRKTLSLSPPTALGRDQSESSPGDRFRRARGQGNLVRLGHYIPLRYVTGSQALGRFCKGHRHRVGHGSASAMKGSPGDELREGLSGVVVAAIKARRVVYKNPKCFQHGRV